MGALNEQKSYEGHEIQSFSNAANGWAPRTYKSLYSSRAPAQDRFGNMHNIVPEGYQYPGIAAGNLLGTAPGFSELSWGFFGAVAGHPTEHRGTILGRARAKRGAWHRRGTGLGQFLLKL